MINEDPAIKMPVPYLSMDRPAKGDIATAHRPPRLTAPENKPLDHPSCSVMGTTNTDRVATAITVRVVRLTVAVSAAIIHP